MSPSTTAAFPSTWNRLPLSRRSSPWPAPSKRPRPFTRSAYRGFPPHSSPPRRSQGRSSHSRRLHTRCIGRAKAGHEARVTGMRPALNTEGPGKPGLLRYFLLRRWWRVLRSNLRCFFFDIRLRRFLMTEPTGYLHVGKRVLGLTLNSDHRTFQEGHARSCPHVGLFAYRTSLGCFHLT